MVFYNQEIELRDITVQDVYKGDYRVVLIMLNGKKRLTDMPPPPPNSTPPDSKCQVC